MSEFLIYVYGYVMGLILGYIMWAPDTNFKKAFLDGLTFKFLWKK